MARNTGRIGVDWETPTGHLFEWDHVKIEVLMDIRAELRRIRSVLECKNTIDIPNILRSIRTNTTKPKRKRAKKRGGK